MFGILQQAVRGFGVSGELGVVEFCGKVFARELFYHFHDDSNRAFSQNRDYPKALQQFLGDQAGPQINGLTRVGQK